MKHRLNEAFCVCLKNKTLRNCLFFFFSITFQNDGEFGAKTCLIDLRAATTIQLFVAIKRNFSGLFFSKQVTAKRNSPETS